VSFSGFMLYQENLNHNFVHFEALLLNGLWQNCQSVGLVPAIWSKIISPYITNTKA